MQKQHFLFLLFCFMSFQVVCEADVFYKRVPAYNHFYNRRPVYSNRVQPVAPTNISNSSTLDMMEQALFNRSFNNENINTRLSRLEENMFGESINGTIGQRYRNLTGAFNYAQPNPYYYNSPYSAETSKKLGIINKLANFLCGTTTGISPELNDYGFDESYSSPFGHGYFRRQNGSGTTVRVLD